jgi:hypothetical protein
MGKMLQKARIVLFAILLLVLSTAVYLHGFEVNLKDNMLGHLVGRPTLQLRPKLTMIDFCKLAASCACVPTSVKHLYKA